MRFHMASKGALVGALMLLPATSQAAVTILDVDDSGRFAHLSIVGEIVQSDVPRFDAIVRKLRPQIETIDVELNSPGGDVLAAIAIGKTIRTNSLWTIASDDPGAACASACVLILAAGVVRIASESSHVEIHRPYFQQSEFAKLDSHTAQQRYSQMAERVKTYLTEMGMSAALFEDMLRVPSDQGEVISSGQMQSYGLSGWNPAYQEWIKAKTRRRIAP